MKRIFLNLVAATCLGIAAQNAAAQTQIEPSSAFIFASPISLLGATPGEVETALPGVLRARQGRRLASGAVAQLRQSDVAYGDLHFDQTLYFLERKLVEIELIERPPAADNGFAILAAALETQFGAPLSAGDTAFWQTGSADIALYRLFRSGHSMARMVIRQHQEHDASQL